MIDEIAGCATANCSVIQLCKVLIGWREAEITFSNWSWGPLHPPTTPNPPLPKPRKCREPLSWNIWFCLNKTQKNLALPELTLRTNSRCSPRWSAFHYAISSCTYRCVTNPHLWIMYLAGLCRVSSHGLLAGRQAEEKRPSLSTVYLECTLDSNIINL